MVRLTSQWNKKLLISIMSASDARRGQGTCSDTQNPWRVVKLRDLPGVVISGQIWSEQGEHPGNFGVPTPQVLIQGAQAGTAFPRQGITYNWEHPSSSVGSGRRKAAAGSRGGMQRH